MNQTGVYRIVNRQLSPAVLAVSRRSPIGEGGTWLDRINSYNFIRRITNLKSRSSVFITVGNNNYRRYFTTKYVENTKVQHVGILLGV